MIYIIRHGQTEMNQANVLQGRSDHPLNETGKEQARMAGEWFRKNGITFDRIYSSPLIRAVQTACFVSEGKGQRGSEKDLIRGDLKPVTDERLIEMDYGPYEGMSLKDPAPEVLAFFMDFQNTPAPEGMEPLEEVVRRSGEFLEAIKKEAETETILISTHAIAMKGLLEYLTPMSKGGYWSKYIGNCAVYTARVENGDYTVPEELNTEA